jgi:fatty-acyl-CoA synthase
MTGAKSMDKPALSYGTLKDIKGIEAIPLSERLKVRTPFDIIRQAAHDRGDELALCYLPTGRAGDEPEVFSFRDYLARVTQTANMFHDLGVRPGTSVSYLLGNHPETYFTIWGGETAGVVNAINPLLQADHIAEIMAAAGSRVLVVPSRESQPELWQLLPSIRKQCPKLDTVLELGGAGDGRDGVLGFSDLVSRYSASELGFARDTDPDRVVACFHTGGTTGTPKLAQHTGFGQAYNAWAIAQALGLSAGQRMLCGLPLFHVNAVMVGGLAPLYAGAACVLVGPQGYRDRQMMQDFWNIVEKYRINTFSAVPTIYARLLDLPVDGADLTSLTYGLCGAAPMSTALFEEFERRTGVRILEGYGMTEAVCVSAFNPREGERRVGSIGLRIPYQDMKVVQLNSDARYERDCAPDEIGNLLIRGPNVFPGYRQNVHNENIWADDGWFNTGDMARQDREGYFWLTGRAKDLIIRGGHNIDPAVIEDALITHEAVELAAAVGKPDRDAGEIPVAYVTVRNSSAVSAAELRDHARARVSDRAAAPSEVIIIDTMPVTAVGKIFKPTLRMDIIKRALMETLSRELPPGVDIVVSLESDDRVGTLFQITLNTADGDLEKRAAQVLRNYSVNYTINVTSGAD